MPEEIFVISWLMPLWIRTASTRPRQSSFLVQPFMKEQQKNMETALKDM